MRIRGLDTVEGAAGGGSEEEEEEDMVNKMRAVGCELCCGGSTFWLYFLPLKSGIVYLFFLLLYFYPVCKQRSLQGQTDGIVKIQLKGVIASINLARTPLSVTKTYVYLLRTKE